MISLVLVGSDGWGVAITDIELWGGIMKAGHNYFERGNLDIFSGRGLCISIPLCRMKLASDENGSHHGWYCNYMEITIIGPQMGCAQQQFTVKQWLARWSFGSSWQSSSRMSSSLVPAQRSSNGSRSLSSYCPPPPCHLRGYCETNTRHGPLLHGSLASFARPPSSFTDSTHV